MQAIDTHPTFMHQTVDRRQARFVAEREMTRLAALASRTPTRHGAGARRTGSATGSWLEQLARRIRSAFGTAA